MAETSGKGTGNSSKWDEESLRAFYQAFHASGQDWQEVSKTTVNKTPDECEALWKQHTSFLAIPSQPAYETAFIAMVKDRYNNIKEGSTADQPGEGAAAGNGSGSDANKVASGEGSKPGADSKDATQSELRGEDGTADEQEEDGSEAAEEGPAPAADGAGRPVRSTRGKPPRLLDPGEDEPSKGRAGTPSKGGKGTPGKGASKAGDVPDSARKRRGRRLFNEDGTDQAGAEDGTDEQGRAPVFKGKRDAKAFEQGVDALMQLAMATVDVAGDGIPPAASAAEESGHEGEEEAEEGGLPGAGVDRPGKRKVRPPSRLEDAFASPSKQSATPSKKLTRAGSGTPTMQQAVRSPRGTPRGGAGRAGASKLRTKSKADDDEELEEEEVEEDTEEEMDVDVPRSARRRGARDSKEAGQAGGQGQAGGEALGTDGQPFTLDSATLAAMGMDMGRLTLPGLPNSNTAGFNVNSLKGPGGSGLGGGGSKAPLGVGNCRTYRRKPEKSNTGATSAAQMAQQQLLLRSLLGMGGGDTSQAALNPPATPETALNHFLSSPKARQWITYEWLYSSIDRPFFMRNEMSDMLTSIGLGHINKLTRGEWNMLRGAWGKPRRLSLHFLKEERVKLEAYREHVRWQYEQLGLGQEVPAELPRPLRVGQEVTARHPTTKQLHDGVILTIKKNTYRVQFHRPDLMTEVVQDTDVMPCDPRGNLPVIMQHTPALLNGRSTAHAGGGQGPLARAKARGPIRTAAPPQPLMPAGMIPVSASTAAEDPEGDAALVAEVSAKLEAKDALLARLRELNNEAETGAHQDRTGHYLEPLQLQYTQVVLQLKEINAALDAAYQRLQTRSQAAALGMLQSGAGIAGPSQLAPAASGLGAGLLGLGGADGGQGSGAPPGQQLVGSLMLPLPVHPSDLTAQAVLHAAYTDAKNVVTKYRADAQAGQGRAAGAVDGDGVQGGAGDTSNAAPDTGALNSAQQTANATAAGLDKLVTGCLTVLCTLHRSTGEGMSLQAIDPCLELALQTLQQSSSSSAEGGQGQGVAADNPNVALYQEVADTVRMLKSLLVKASV